MSILKEEPEQFRFVVQIGIREADSSFPLRAFARRGVGGRTALGVAEGQLLLPERLLAQARRLLEPYERQPVGDEAELGVFLARQILPRAVRALLLETVALAREHESALCFELAIDPPELAALPWEWLTVAGKSHWSPALLEDYGLTRLVSRHGSPRAGPYGSGALIVAPDASDATLRAIGAALRASPEPTLPLEVLLAPSNAQLRATLRRRRPRVLHLLARAEFDAPDAPLLFLDTPVDAAELVALASPSAPPLVLLDGGWHAEGKLAAAGPRLAYALAEAGADEAIAFHSALYPDESALFALSLYAALAADTPTHQAVALARQALFAGGAAAAWGLPMLVRCNDGVTARRATLPMAERLRGLPLPGRLRELAVPLIAGGAGLLVAASVFLWQPRVTTETAAATRPPIGIPGTVVATNFAISLPTPSFAPPVATPTAGASQPLSQAQPTPAVLPDQPLRWATYLVQPGDTVEAIAAKMGSDAATLATLNRVDVGATLIPGRGLMVPVYRDGAASAGGLDVKVGRQDQPVVALTIDTEINDVMLYQILDILNARGLHATFFVTGRWTTAYPDAARAILASGNELGNHSLTHPTFTQIGLDGAVNELVETERIVRETTGVSTHPFFRFPYGAKNQQLLNLLAEQGYISYHWSADDGAISGWLANVAANPRSGYGGILLMHERTTSIAALPGWLDQLQQLGFKVVPLSQILK